MLWSYCASAEEVDVACRPDVLQSTRAAAQASGKKATC